MGKWLGSKKAVNRKIIREINSSAHFTMTKMT